MKVNREGKFTVIFHQSRNNPLNLTYPHMEKMLSNLYLFDEI